MSQSVKIVKAESSHIERIANGMRMQDAFEIWASHRSTPYSALLAGIQSERCWTGLIDGKPVCMFGVNEANILTAKGTPWMLATNEVESVKKQFIIQSRVYIIKAMKDYRLLENYVHEDNAMSIRWLKWIGFEIKEKISLGFEGEMFYRFEMRNNHV